MLIVMGVGECSAVVHPFDPSTRSMGKGEGPAVACNSDVGTGHDNCSQRLGIGAWVQDSHLHASPVLDFLWSYVPRAGWRLSVQGRALYFTRNIQALE